MRGCYCAAEVDDARRLRDELDGVTLGGERLGVRIDGFDLGNSPREYLEPRSTVLSMSTTNGTRAIVTAAERCERVVVGLAPEPRGRRRRRGLTRRRRRRLLRRREGRLCARRRLRGGPDRGGAGLRAHRTRPRRRVRLVRTVQRRGGGVPPVAQRPQPDQPRARSSRPTSPGAHARACSRWCPASSGCTG